jgi:signal transduction histidine kinase
VRISHEASVGLFDLLAQQGSLNVRLSEWTGNRLADACRGFGLTTVIALPVDRAGAVAGVLLSGYRRRAKIFTPHQVGVAREIAALASLALERKASEDDGSRDERLWSKVEGVLSHEVRTPVHTIVGYLGLLLEGALGELTEAQSSAVRSAARNAMRLNELVEATCAGGDIRDGSAGLQLAQVDPRALAEAIDIEIRRLRRSSSSVSVSWNIAAALPRIRTDAATLTVVLRNLISNAIMFTDVGGVVAHVDAVPGGIEFTISDTGIGIAAEHQQSIFDAFHQVDSSSTRRHEGIGLGLYIVRNYVDLLGGSIAIESAVGAGSKFRVRIPDRAETAVHRSDGMMAAAARSARPKPRLVAQAGAAQAFSARPVTAGDDLAGRRSPRQRVKAR